MKFKLNLLWVALLLFGLTSCVTTKKFDAMKAGYEEELTLANEQIGKYGEDINQYMNRLSGCESTLRSTQTELVLRKEQIDDLKSQLSDLRTQRDKQVEQVEDLAVISQSANDNIKETLSQLQKKDKYIQLLQTAKSKADSINLALAVNLKTVLKDGIEDNDVDIKVDKTVVFINLSDKMLYESGSYNLTSRANEVLSKIAKIVESRPEFEVMVEGYTDDVSISTTCIEDNWDLSVKRATSVVRALQERYNVDPNRLIAAGRGQYNTLASNNTAAGRATNRRTRIVILPKLNQFYDLLNPNLAAN